MKFLLLSAGGTITSADTERGFVPTPIGERLFEYCPLLMGFEHDVEIADIFSKDSSNMNPNDWLTIAKAIREADCDAVILLHGTDTMAWTAAALSYLLIDLEIPVIMTGSMIPAGKPESDAPDNIYAAFQFGVQLAMYKRKGVSIAFADVLIHGPKAVKADSRRKKAFVSVDYPLLGEMLDKGSHKIAWLTSHNPEFQNDIPDIFNILWKNQNALNFETNIALLPIFPGIQASVLDAIIKTAPKAVLLEGFGLGGIPYMSYIGDNILESIKHGILSGILFLIRTQSLFGGTNPAVYEVGKKILDLGVISAQNMTREALMTKLMLLLPNITKDIIKNHKEIEKYLFANLCDDISCEYTNKI